MVGAAADFRISNFEFRLAESRATVSPQIFASEKGRMDYRKGEPDGHFLFNLTHRLAALQAAASPFITTQG
jgi:hypothetical protein